MSDPAMNAALPFVSWGRLWSPLLSAGDRAEAWRELELPGDYGDQESNYLATFHVGMPLPTLPLLLHAALGREGGQAREEWMRVLQFLDLRWAGSTLPPDHLAVACEALATAVHQRDEMLVAELCARYLLPWCEQAALRSLDSVMADVVACFEQDIRSIDHLLLPKAVG